MTSRRNILFRGTQELKIQHKAAPKLTWTHICRIFSAKTETQTFKELTTLLRLMFTLTSVLFLHNKWQQNEHDTHLYDSSLWKYSTHQTCFAMYQSTKNIYNCNCENREKHRLKHKSPICCICAWKSAYCVRTKERGGHQREGGRRGGRDYWVWWLPLQCWWNSQQTQR